MKTKAKKVVNSVVVNVRQKHIKAGDPGNPRACPIAMALEEQLKPHKEGDGSGIEDDIFVLTSHVRFTRIERNCMGDLVRRYRYAELPKTARKFVQKFDTHQKVKPIKTRLVFSPETETYLGHYTPKLFKQYAEQGSVKLA